MTTPGPSRRATLPSPAPTPDQTVRRGPRAGGPAHARSLRTHRVSTLVGLVLAGILAFGGTAATAFYLTLQGNVTEVDLAGLIDEDLRPPEPTPDPEDPDAGTAVNILLIGSDDRSGENAAIGGEDGGMRSDTTIVMHISADRSRVELVSIPRDSLVDLPACETTQGTVEARDDTMFNNAFARGWDTGGDIASAASCTMRAVESLTDVRLSGFVMVDFVGFQGMVDAIGGVPMTIPEEIVAPEAGLHLQPGEQVLDGTQALGLARARKGTGPAMDGSDLHRIDRQQELLGAMAGKVLSQDVLSDTPALMSFLGAATSSLTASPEYSSLRNLAGLALSLRGIAPEDITFLTTPVVDSTKQRYRVEWTQEAYDMWARMAADEPVAGPADVTR